MIRCNHLQSLANLVRLALRPIPDLHDLWEMVVIGALLLGVALAPPAWVSEWFEQSRWFFLLGAITTLLLWAGIRLQFEKDERDRADFDLIASHRPFARGHLLPEGPYHTGTSLRVAVKNRGPTAEFTAQVLEVVGARRSDGKPVKVNEVAWEHDIQKRYPIERAHESPLRLAELATTPQKALWFWTAKTYTYGAQAGHAAGTRLLDLDTEIQFVLAVHNVDADKTITADGTVTLRDNGEVENFTLVVRGEN